MGEMARRRPSLPAGSNGAALGHWDRLWLHETQRWLYSMDLHDGLSSATGDSAAHDELAAALPEWCDVDGVGVAEFVQRCEQLWAGLAQVRTLCADGEWAAALPEAERVARVAQSFGNDRVLPGGVGRDGLHGQPEPSDSGLAAAVRRIRGWAASSGLDAESSAELLSLAGVLLLVLGRPWGLGDAAALLLARGRPDTFPAGAALAGTSPDERYLLVLAGGVGKRQLCKRHHFHDTALLPRQAWTAAMGSLELRRLAQWPPPVIELIADMQRSVVDELAASAEVSKAGNRRDVADRIARAVGGPDMLDQRVWPTWQYDDRRFLVEAGIFASPALEAPAADPLTNAINDAGSLAWYGPRQYALGAPDAALARLARTTTGDLVEPVLGALFPSGW